MSVFRSQIDPSSDAFRANRTDMLALVDKLRRAEARAAALSEKRRPRFEERGQLTPRERLTRVLDPGMPFFELMNLNNYLVDETDSVDHVAARNARLGIGIVDQIVVQIHELEERHAGIEHSREPLPRGEKRRPRFEERGQLTPRERLTRVLDPGMPFFELMNLNNYLVDDADPETSIPGGNMIHGIGFVAGVRTYVFVDDSGIAAGAATTMSVEKVLAGLSIARRQKLPYLHLVESAGANLMNYTVELWAKGGGMFNGLALLSADGIPTVVVLHGPSTAGGAYQPGMSDYVIGVKKNGMAALGGAALVKAATGEVADERELGGSEMHSQVTGLVEYLAEDDAHALLLARDLMGRLGWNDRCPSRPPREYAPPLYDADEIAGVVPVDYRKPYDVREVVARVVDGSDFAEFKPRYGPSTVCLQAEIMGQPCGIIGNNGPIDPNGATKAGHFFQLCDSSQTPLLFLNNTTGYMVGLEYEQAGMIKHGSKMIQAVSNVRVPKISLYIGASFGAGNYGMCGYAFSPDFLLTWPNAMTGVMGGEQAARTMEQVMRGAAARRGIEVDEETLAAQSAQLTAHFDAQSDAFFTSGRTLDHGMIDPRDTRKVLGFLLETCWEARHRTLHPNAFGVARM